MFKNQIKAGLHNVVKTRLTGMAVISGVTILQHTLATSTSAALPENKEEQEALLLQRNRATRYVSWNIMAVFWLSYWQEALLIQRNDASTLSVEIVYNAAQMFDGLHVKTSATGEWPSRSFKVTAVATIW